MTDASAPAARRVIAFFLPLLIVYAAAVAALWYWQRNLVFPGARHPNIELSSRVSLDPRNASLPAFTGVVVETPDGESLRAWWRAPDPGRPVIFFLHGNGGSIADRAPRARALTADGAGLLLLSYRGYEGSSGSPSEEGLATDALAGFDWIRARQPDAPIVLYGESLGSGVAVRLALERPVAGLILDAPYTSLVDVAAGRYWFMPVRALMSDRFDSLARIGAVKAPILVMHGDRDGVVPFSLGERLFAAAPEPKRFIRVAGGEHMGNLEAPEGSAAARDFLAEFSR